MVYPSGQFNGYIQKRVEEASGQGPKEHEWEVGYKGYPLEFYTAMIEQVGYRITATDYVPSGHNIMMLCRNDRSMKSRV